MSDRMSTDRRQSLWEKFKNKMYRDTFVSGHLSTNIAAQIFAIREARGWTQEELAEAADMAQTRISVMEKPDYENFSLKTLKRLAAAFDVGLVVRFVPFSELLEWANNITPEKMAVPEFKDDQLARPDPRVATMDDLRERNAPRQPDIWSAFGHDDAALLRLPPMRGNERRSSVVEPPTRPALQ